MCGLLTSAVRSPPLLLIQSRQNEEDVRRACLSTSATCTDSHSTQGGARRPIPEPLNKAAFQITPILNTSFLKHVFHYSLQVGIYGIPLVESQLQRRNPFAVSFAYGRSWYSSKSL